MRHVLEASKKIAMARIFNHADANGAPAAEPDELTNINWRHLIGCYDSGCLTCNRVAAELQRLGTRILRGRRQR